jgi:hypothetical protein
MNEAEIMRRVQLALGSRDDVRIWRSSTGVARALDAPERIQRFGQAGAADLTGILRGGRRLEVEVKSERGRLQANQRAYGQMITTFGGVYLVVRNVDEAVAAVEAAIAGRV